ncbi:MAG: FUSC family protein [Candidatus Acidiferrales bacterium]
MTNTVSRSWPRADKRELMHAVRTTVAATGALLIARLLRLPEAYWAAITTMIVMQSTLGAAWTISKQRLAGTAIGTGLAALLATYLGASWAVFGGGVLVAGVICAVLAVGRNAYRYSGITVAIIVLVTTSDPYWLVAVHRLVEIALGIAVALAITAAWPEAEAVPARS